ncbi:hypothetical protein V8B97DRAFT_27979 [Scleroderma yunnanense]
MSTPFAFVPRQLSRPTKPQGAEPSKRPTRHVSPTPTSDSDDSDDDDSKAPDGVGTLKDSKGKGRAVNDPQTQDVGRDIAALALLALSDHKIWSDADLRRKLDECLQCTDASTAGFVPINYLMRRPPFRGSWTAELSETEVVKALRTYASEMLQVRMLVSAPSSSVWYGTGKTSRKKDVGGYEVRRKDWETLLDHPLRKLRTAQWEERTVYMECVPTQCRSIAGIARFTQLLLLPVPLPCSILVQNVTLPPHHQDIPGDIPKCRGYALVTLSTTEQRDTLLDKWPWTRRLVNVDDDSGISEIREARKFGFRTISKTRWDQLNEEYVAYRQKLVDEAVESNRRAFPHRPDMSAHMPSEDEKSLALESCPDAAVLETTYASSYPYGCLVFVRHVQPETNKTTLKALFSKSFARAGQTSGLDYVDFNKGMDSCHLRLASPRHSTTLMDHFIQHPIVQSNGLDDTGRTPEKDEKEIKMEVIQGKKEELYWEKIPEKVRRQAVEKAIQAQSPDASTSSNVVPSVRGPTKRKR